MKTLIQSQIISVPATTGSLIYKTQFASDKNYKYITGIACILVSGSLSQDIEVEFKDDNGVIFSMSPAANWIKDSTDAGKDLTELFRSVEIVSKGRNMYCNVKASNTSEDVKFVVYYMQSNEEGAVKQYNFESYPFEFDSLPSTMNLTLPTQYKKVVGVAAVTDSTEAAAVVLRVENTQRNLIDNIQLSALKVTPSTLYDHSFMPVEFAADGQEVKLVAEALDTVTGPVTGKIYFLLTD